jgi:hypothetical protein
MRRRIKSGHVNQRIAIFEQGGAIAGDESRGQSPNSNNGSKLVTDLNGDGVVDMYGFRG